MSLLSTCTDDESAIVKGVLTSQGFFDGSITTRNEEYYLEPADRYFINIPDFHSIIYRISDVTFPRNSTFCAHHKLLSTSALCSSESNLDKKYSENEYFSTSSKIESGGPVTLSTGGDVGAVRENNYLFSQFINNSVNTHRANLGLNNKDDSRKRRVRRQSRSDANGDAGSEPDDNKKPYYWRDVDALHYGDSEPYGVRAVQRTHWAEDRLDRHVVIDPKKTTCMLYLQADHLFYEKMGSDEACIEAMTRHVQKVNNIYKNTGK